MDGFGDALLGTVLLARLPVQPPEVLFFVPGDDEERDDGNSPDEENPESLDELEPESSFDDFSILRSRNMGAPVMSSAEDLNRHSLQYFGVPSTTLAKLMIPMSEDQICNQLMVSEVDAGKFEYTHKHNTKENHDHLLFVSYPCGFAKIANRQPDEWEKPLPKSQLVQCFNIVHVLDSKIASRLEARVRVLGEATEQVQKQLCTQENQTGYVSWEVRRLKELIRAKSTGNAADPSVVFSPHPLENLIRDLYNTMKESGSQKLQVNGNFVFPNHEFTEDAVEVSELQGISLFRSQKDVESDLSPETEEHIKTVVQHAQPWLSLADLCNITQLDICTLQRAAQQLIVTKKAKVVNVFRENTRVALAQGIDTSKDSKAAERFAEWRKKHERARPRTRKEAREKKLSTKTFTEALKLFHQGVTIKEVQEEFKNNGEYELFLGYLVAQGMVVQLGHFCHFMPFRASRPALELAPKCHELRAVHLWDPSSPWDPAVHLKESEFRVLESLTTDVDVLRFFVLVVLRIARPHRRLDSTALDDFLKEIGGKEKGWTPERALELLQKNKDVFLLYNSRS